MKTILVMISLAIFGFGIVIGRFELSEKKNVIHTDSTEKVLSSDTENTSENNPSSTPIPTITIKPTVTPTIPVAVASNSLTVYKYPNSTVVSIDNNSMVLRSDDDTGLITQWYKDKIVEKKMSVKTFISTKANDKILNKLNGVSGDEEVEIEISKSDQQSNVEILVKLTS